MDSVPPTNRQTAPDIPESTDPGGIRAPFGPTGGSPPSPRTPGWTLWLVLALWAAILAIRVIGPSDLLDNDQLGPAAYANDAIVNGNWLVQTDVQGAIASKPPLTTWLIALPSIPFGHATIATLIIPSAGAVLGCALLALFFGARHLGRTAGAAAALAVLLCPMGAKQITLIRTDAFYALVTGVAMLLAWRAWRTAPRAWILFWLAAAAVTLTKGPVGLLVPAGAMLAAIWERRTPAPARANHSRSATLAAHAIGIVLFFAVIGAWFALAWSSAGDPFVQKILGVELVGHAVHSDSSGALPFTGFYNPPFYFLTRFAPASIFTFVGLLNAWKRPSADTEHRALQRFLACAFLIPMIAFSISPHQRPDHLTPIWLAGALLAGREIAPLASSLAPRARAATTATWIAGALLAMVVQFDVLARNRPEMIRARAIRALAAEIEALPTRVPMLHVNDNSSLQFFLHTMDHRVSPEAGADALAGDAPILVASAFEPGDLDTALAQRGASPQIVASWSDEKGWGIRVLANPAAMEALSR